MRSVPIPMRLAALAGLAAAIASLAGFIPGLYRDPAFLVGQSHGYDVGNLIVVAVLGGGLAWWRTDPVRGRLVVIGALACLLYGYVTYAFYLLPNPATPLSIAVLGLGGWAFALGLGDVDADAAEGLLAGGRLRRATAALLALVGVLFAVTWLRQLVGPMTGGPLPAEVVDAGWPMNPIWVLDLAFVLPAALVAAWLLWTRRRHGARLAVALLVFFVTLGVTILAMVAGAWADGQAVDPGMPAIFVALVGASALLAALTLAPHPPRLGSAGFHGSSRSL